MAEAFVRHVQQYIPNFLLRLLSNVGIFFSVASLTLGWEWPQDELDFIEKSKKLENDTKKIAVKTEAANEQHYEVNTDFFKQHLGKHLKYSSCEWNKSTKTLEDAEKYTIERYISLLQLEDSDSKYCKAKRVLDIGCGWGSFSLYAAKKYKNIQFVCFSNSRTQFLHISSEIETNNLTNLKVKRLDINEMSLNALGETSKFDRVISIECLEHSKNYEEIFLRIRNMLDSRGLCMFQLLCHREYSYDMDDTTWMGRNFFTGGTIPSTKLFYHFNKDLVVTYQEVIKGNQYGKTLNAWLNRLEAKREIMINKYLQQKVKRGADGEPEFVPTEDPIYEYEKWRLFYLLCAQSFSFRSGQEWMVTYLTMEPRERN